MAVLRNSPQPAPRTDLHDHLRDRLRRLQARLIERDGGVDPLFAYAYGLDRLDDLAAGRDVPVHGYEITDALSREDRPRVDPLGRYTLRADGLLDARGNSVDAER